MTYKDLPAGKLEDMTPPLIGKVWPTCSSNEWYEKFLFPIVEGSEHKMQECLKHLENFINETIDGTAEINLLVDNPVWDQNKKRDKGIFFCSIIKQKP